MTEITQIIFLFFYCGKKLKVQTKTIEQREACGDSGGKIS